MQQQQKSFKENVLNKICDGAQVYKDFFLDYEYEITSKFFASGKPFIISATKTNFLHLTGVNTKLSAIQFFDKALKRTLSINDFDFNKKGQTEKMVKGSVRRKVRFLPELDKIFSIKTLAEENFIKNKIYCSFAVSDNSFTVGFIATPFCRPKTLLKGNELKKPFKIDSIKRRKKNDTNFEEFLN